MIVCPVCKTHNDEFAIRCISCGSYVQDRVPTLDLFSVLWLMIESPSQAFRKIILSEHKNYVLVIGLFLGIAASFILMWAKQSGNSFDNLFPAMAFGTMIGVLLALPLTLLLTLCMHYIAVLIGGKGKLKETYGVVGWSFMPMIFLVVFVLPLQLAALGLYAFSSNPSAYQMKPVVTAVLLGLEGLLILWSIVLLGIGMSMVHRFAIVKSVIMVTAVTGAVGYGIFLIYSSFNI
ncbi:MAG: Yip1 family protein [Bacteroidota bacterium]